jgi:hypothetical protein
MRVIIQITLFCILILAVSSSCFAQYDGRMDFNSAVELYTGFGKNKSAVQKLDSAKDFLEKAFLDPTISSTSNANTLFGAIYKELYKARESDNINSNYRKLATEKFMRAWEMDTSKKNRDNVKNQLKWIANQMNNDAKRTLEKNADIETARQCLSNFKKIYAVIEPGFSHTAKDIEFELAVGSALMEKAEQTGKKEYFDLAKVSYLRVLDLDTANNDANYNIGIIYYNQGANLIMKVLDFDTPLDSISIIEEMAKKLFIQAKPFMHKANFEKPSCMKILEGLMGIYYSLNDEDNFKEDC